MTNERVKEILGKQLELLAEKSKDGTGQSLCSLPSYTSAMIAIATFLKEG